MLQWHSGPLKDGLNGEKGQGGSRITTIVSWVGGIFEDSLHRRSLKLQESNFVTSYVPMQMRKSGHRIFFIPEILHQLSTFTILNGQAGRIKEPFPFQQQQPMPNRTPKVIVPPVMARCFTKCLSRNRLPGEISDPSVIFKNYTSIDPSSTSQIVCYQYRERCSGERCSTSVNFSSQWHPAMAPSNGTPAMAPQQWHPSNGTPAMEPSNGTQQWRPAMAPNVNPAKVGAHPPPIGSKNPYS